MKEDIFFFMLYAAVAMLALIACCYLLLRRGNAFAADITPPLRLRRWTAVFFAAIALCHLWYLPTYFLTSGDERMLYSIIAELLDCITVIPLAIVVLLTMLQDRRRPLWPVCVIMAPCVVGLAWCAASSSEDLMPMLLVYFLLMCVGLIIYMVRALRQYGRWLRENYADLENKEVWQSFVVLAIILLGYAIYVLDAGEQIYEYATEVINVVLVCYLLWRVETLQNLQTLTSRPTPDPSLTGGVGGGSDYPQVQEPTYRQAEEVTTPLLPPPSREGSGVGLNIGPLLKQHCEEPQLYLQYDISLSQLATLIGVNRTYLSKHFSLHGITYNTYINGLRIQHFINLYHAAVATHQPISVQQLAFQSGFRSYSTFNAAFKQNMGKTATEWMHNISDESSPA